MEENTRDKVTNVLNGLRPMLMADGGDVELLDVDEGIVRLRLQGACGHCPMSQLTLKMGIERELKRQIPEIKEVVAM